jgi:hypothetical protein
MKVINVTGNNVSATVDIVPDDYQRLSSYAVAGYSGCNGSGFMQWRSHKCYYDVRKPPIKPSLIGDCSSSDNSLTMQWNTVDCSPGRASRTGYFSLKIREHDKGDGIV